MNLVSLLILPAVINLQDNDGARYSVAAAALVVLGIAIAFSKRRSGGIAAGPTHAVSYGDPPLKLAVDALDRWIMDLSDEEHDLRKQLRAARAALQSGGNGSAAPTPLAVSYTHLTLPTKA